MYGTSRHLSLHCWQPRPKWFKYAVILERYPRGPFDIPPRSCVPNLSISAQFGIIGFVNTFVNGGDDLDEEFPGRIALGVASENGHLGTVQVLVRCWFKCDQGKI